ncbi:12350_t:CDS:2, partial [Ambispora gerdemannii]
ASSREMRLEVKKIFTNFAWFIFVEQPESTLSDLPMSRQTVETVEAVETLLSIQYFSYSLMMLARLMWTTGHHRLQVYTHIEALPLIQGANKYDE